MKKETLERAVGNIDDKFLNEANEVRMKGRYTKVVDFNSRKKNIRRWCAGIGTVAACCAIAFVGLWGVNHKKGAGEVAETIMFDNAGEASLVANDAAISTASFEECAAYPYAWTESAGDTSDGEDSASSEEKWSEQRSSRIAAGDAVGSSLNDFYEKSIKQIIGTKDAKENALYSPVNVYMALAMLAESTNGDSRAQLLDIIGVDSIEELREQVANVLQATYRNDGLTTSIPAGSIWMNKGISYKEDALNLLADTYKTSSFIGSMGDEEYNKALRNWINDNTGNLLEDQANGLEFNKETMLAIVSTLYFKADWANEFFEEETDSRTFHGAKGDEQFDFMHGEATRDFYEANGFKGTTLSLKDGGEMFVFLPDENKTVNDVLNSKDMYEIIFNRYEYENRASARVNVSIPKFDVKSTIALKDDLESLGAKDIFDASKADFSSILVDSKDVCVNQADHSVRVRIDEDGLEAAAYTVMMMGSTGFNSQIIDITFDRPFVFVIVSDTEEPLFVGTVNTLK